MILKFFAALTSNAPLSEHCFTLNPGTWDDYFFKTSFQVIYSAPGGQRLDLGTVKIGFVGQTSGWTKDSLPATFDALEQSWFSLGQDVKYYQLLHSSFPEQIRNEFLKRIRDVATFDEVYEMAAQEKVFGDSLMRSVSPSVINGQYKRVLRGSPALSEFKFSYVDNGSDIRAPINLSFRVDPDSKPPTNIHVIIGRNGIGKTTLLNNMVHSALNDSSQGDVRGQFYVKDRFNLSLEDLPQDYFSCVVSVSFSAFDPFVPPADRPDRSRGLAYFYVGMKKPNDSVSGQRKFAKSKEDLIDDLLKSIGECFSQPLKKQRWFSAIGRLESDSNFKEIGFSKLASLADSETNGRVKELVKELSSGHSVVLLSITKLVETVEEKTLVLMDEPESHLHPPLLSAFTRALSDLLHDRNAVAIIATHSPVVVQEVPSTCVWKLHRSGNQARSDRPDVETFGENVGVLTREIFGLEVSKSGFHSLLQTAVKSGKTFDQIMAIYEDQLGFEAQAILRTLVREHVRVTGQ